MSDQVATTAERAPRDRRRELEALLRKKAQQSRTFPLSFAQERLWILDRLDPDNPVYNIPLAMRLRGELDVQTLEQTLNEVVGRHESLRTKIVTTGDTAVQVIETAGPQKLLVVDLEHIKPAEREAEALARAEAEARKPFRLDVAPLFRASLLRFSATDHVLIVVMHHIISDDWSLAVLFHEVALAYRAFKAGEPSPLEPLPIQYADFAVWQRQQLQGEALERLLDYWKPQLRGVASLELPTEQSRSRQLRQTGDTEESEVPPALVDRLREMGRHEGATLYMTMLAALQVLLHRYSGQEDFAIGSPIAGRLSKETERLVGFFINTLVMRADLSGNPTFRDVLRCAKRTALEAFQHQELPFERLVDALNPQRGANQNPLFQVMFTLQNSPWPEVQVAGLTLSVIPLYNGMARFPLSFTVREQHGGLWIDVDYRSDLFRPITVQRLLKHFRAIIEAVVAQPDVPVGQLPLLTQAERSQLLDEWNDTSRNYPTGLCVQEMFEHQAARTPLAVALIDGPRQWTYQELNERANRLAHYLLNRGAKKDQLVAIRLTRSAELIVGILGILKAGAAYLPIDSEAPTERLKFIFDDAQIEILLTGEKLLHDLPAGERSVVCLDRDWGEIEKCSGDSPVVDISDEQLAYVIYTSGSTGRPKGVMIEHQALLNYSQAATELYEITAADRVLQFAAASFDAHVEEVFPCLTQGGTLMLRNDYVLDCKTFLEHCAKWQLTFITLPTGFWHELTRAIVEEGLTVPATLRLLVIGGEAAQADRINAWFRCVGNDIRVLNTYGPTETTVVATAAELGSADGREPRVPIGNPLGNVLVYVLDRGGQPVPVGVPGELYIGGKSLARGYLNRPELTAERFVPDPFARKSGARMYKTGDVVRWRSDGRLEFVGRTDQQVKIRGFRIEPGEIEQVLREHPSVAEAVVAVRERAPGDLQLISYVSGRTGGLPATAELRQFLRDRLPDFMIPAAFVVMELFPLTASGKVDRRALPEPDWSGTGTASEGDFMTPRTETEEQLAAIWSEVLNIEKIGANDNFFDLGGNSLLAMRLAPRVRKVFSVDLPQVAIFIAPTLSELAEEIVSLQMSPHRFDLPTVQAMPRDGSLPTSFAQERFWFLQQLAPESSMLNLHSILRIHGPLDVDTLHKSINNVVQRHESLRTSFTMNREGRLTQAVEPYCDIELLVDDISSLPQAEQTEQIQERSRQQAEEAFDLSHAPLLRTQLLRLGDADHALLVTGHHIICDAWSLDVLSYEVAEIYDSLQKGRQSSLPELSVQYADYAIWQRNYLQGDPLESLLAYWRNKLDGLMPLEVPTDRPRHNAELREQRQHPFQIPARLKIRLERLCSEEGVTPFMLLLAAFQILLHRYSDADDVAIGSPVASRHHADTQKMIGLFVNTLVLRNDLSGDPTFRALLARVRQTAIEAYEHQELPFERLVEEIQPQRDLSKHPLVQVLFDFEQRAVAQDSDHWDELGLRFETVDAVWEVADVFDLVLWLAESPNGWEGEFAYNCSLFDPATIARMTTHFQTLLESIVEDPNQKLSQLSLLTPQERQQVLVEWNQTQVDFPRQGCVHQLFEAEVARAPDATALVFDGRSMSYQQLNARANQLARYLQQRGIGPEAPVGICLEPSFELAVAVVATLKAGGIYLPLDPADPRDRLDFFVADSRPVVVLTKTAFSNRFSAPEAQVVCIDAIADSASQESQANLPCSTTPENAFCILYTSGSTGTPKGAVNLHRGICNYLLAKQEMVGLGPADRILFTTPIGFDTSVEEIFFALTCGGCLVIDKAGGQQRDMSCLLELIIREEVTTACFVPSVLRLLLEEKDLEKCRSLKHVLVGGEVLPREMIERFFEHVDAKLYNEYGPTEASIDVAVWKCRLDYERGVIPIGRPIANVRLYILDSERNPVPIGVPGELYIGGIAVARGYLNRPELNVERFIADPFSPDSNDRLYKTGDRCRWLPDGNIQFLGRRDGQIKIRGGRLELGEVEAAIGRSSSVSQVAVTVRHSSPDYKYLAAYVVPRGHLDARVQARKEYVKELRHFLKSSLPDYMIPQAFEIMDVLPQLSSGKVNRAALPAVAPAAKPAQRYVAPRSPLEQQLAGIWADVLRRDRVGLHDNFFDLGGHSLLAVRMMTQARAALNIKLPVAALFAAPTIAELAERIEAEARGEGSDGEDASLLTELTASLVQAPRDNGQSLIPLKDGGPGTPLFCIHGLGGHVASFLSVAKSLADERPIYALQAQGLGAGQRPHERIEDMAAFYTQLIRQAQPRGPYLLAGWSMGGLIALEMAHVLQATGEETSLVAMFDTYLSADDFAPQDADENSVIRWLAPHLNIPVEELKIMPVDQQWELIAQKAQLADGIGAAEIRRFADVCRAHLVAGANYTPRAYFGRTVLFQSADQDELDSRWQSLCSKLCLETVPGGHYSMLREPHVQALAASMKRHLSEPVKVGEMVTQP